MLKEDALSVQYVRECLSGPGNDAPVVIGGVVQVWYLSDAPSQQMLLSRHAGACHSSPFLEALPQHLRTPHAVCRVSWDLGVEASLDRASPSWQLPCQVRCLCSLISRPFTSTCGYHSMNRHRNPHQSCTSASSNTGIACVYILILCMHQLKMWPCHATDVRLFPFHTTDTALPELEPGSWRDLISGSASSGSGADANRPRERTAGILLSEPHFTAVRCPLPSRLKDGMPKGASPKGHVHKCCCLRFQWRAGLELSLCTACCAEAKTLVFIKLSSSLLHDRRATGLSP